MSGLLIPTRVATPVAGRPRLLLSATDEMLNRRAAERCHAASEDLMDQAATATLAGSPRRGFYLEHWAQQAFRRALGFEVAAIRRVLTGGERRA